METLITLGVEVKVEPFYLPQQSKPVNNEYLYGYTIGIHNYNPYPVQLISRMWQITNGFGDVKYVEGEGVVGRQPVLSNSGPDEVVGTADDTGPAIDGFEREIIITDQCDPERPSPNCAPPGTAPVRVRVVEVRVFFQVGLTERSEVLTTVLTDYSVTE